MSTRPLTVLTLLCLLATPAPAQGPRAVLLSPEGVEAAPQPGPSRVD